MQFEKINALLLVALSFCLACAGGATRSGVLKTDGSNPFTLMDFAEPIPLDPPPEGWNHREFRRHPPMEFSFVRKDDIGALRMQTNDSASMLFRHVDVPLDDYPWLRWQWLIEQGIESEIDEGTTSGDDHPARLYLDFVAADGSEHAMEIIWGNQKFGTGDWKHLTFLGFFDFPHYVANGGAANLGRWHDERVDLTELYRTLWGDPSGARLVDIALFCDSDETGGSSIAYVSHVRVEQ